MGNATILFILQNGYHSEKYQFRNLEEWYVDLERSYTGKRLKKMIPDNADPKVINASENIGNESSSCFPADANYIKKMIDKYKPKIICACGKIAQDGCEEIGIDYIPLPHPAWRQLSNKRVNEIKSKLSNIVFTRSNIKEYL